MDMMEIRRKILSNPPLVAPGYMKVEYIESINWQRIETDYVPTKGDEIECVYQFTKLNSGLRGLFSAGTGSYQVIALANTGNNRAFFYCRYFSGGSAINLYSYNNSHTWYTMKVRADGTFTTNGTSATIPYEHELDGDKTTLYIFRRRDDNNNFIGRLKSFTITNGDILKINFVPCVRLSDNVAGVYDTVSKEFLACPEPAFPFIPGRATY